MKTLLSLLFTLTVAIPAFAQGKVRVVNDSLHLVYWNPDPGISGTNAGQPYRLGDGAVTLTIELWSGTSSSALSRVAVTDFAQQASPGTWAGLNVTLLTAAGPTFFQIDIYDLANPIPNYIYGTSGLFTTVSSSTIAYNSLVNHNSPALSTWADGTYNMDFLSPGFRGAIMLGIPEPSTFALGCLGLTVLFVRRKSDPASKY